MDQHVLTINLKKFFSKHLNEDSAFLLGLSGGPDSMALFHWLRENQVPFAVAHLDHRWRPESSQEALQLQEMTQKNGIPFHLKVLDPDQLKGNLEDACRNERLEFFRELCEEHGYQSVLLGHHQNDLAETVLKRLFEGANLSNLSSMQQVSSRQNLILWRPLLSIPKSEILSYLESKKIPYFQDSTNSDPKYLRSKMRQQIIPDLEQTFGKKIVNPLSQIGSDASELKTYLDEKIQPYLSQIQSSPFGFSLDLSQNIPTHPIELKHLIRYFCSMNSLTPSRDALETIAHHLLSQSANRQVSCQKILIQIDRGRLFIIPDYPSLPEKPYPLSLGSHQLNGWQITVNKVNTWGNPTDWKDLWGSGRAEVILPSGEYELSFPISNHLYPGKSPLRDWWAKHKVPAFFRSSVPLLYREKRVVHEFLSGREPLSSQNLEEGIQVILEISHIS